MLCRKKYWDETCPEPSAQKIPSKQRLRGRRGRELREMNQFNKNISNQPF
jgi:hypothetical protein